MTGCVAGLLYPGNLGNAIHHRLGADLCERRDSDCGIGALRVERSFPKVYFLFRDGQPVARAHIRVGSLGERCRRGIRDRGGT